ncbi:hypothetical protein HELRODRAFT_194040 [Helobdella robusta]|uniref:U6 small nuclear RNA (adenine-(43)-N(6))-methyltransferase n=1 Tax=Helobdella robusta TaxID=6412 RepID=T1FVL5_HELRO|nr:hypothetical protein HELRODRAFT_194040 [Helobdella robusta]ESN93508.1 hypothetical protein HELRODRAFT_194040 [Helobdella robusta]
MAFNDRMHERNIYKRKKPNFKLLAEKYEKFREEGAKIGKNGSYFLNFKDAKCLRALTWALLKDDFNLDVDMPLNRLIPTVPLRLNYILWIEDIFSDKNSNLLGVDIGCGSSCIYALIGAKKNNWKFVAADVDAVNYDYALKNVANNDLSDHIKVIHTDLNSNLQTIFNDYTCEDYFKIKLSSESPSSSSSIKIDFCICNPPFFESTVDLLGSGRSRSDDRPDPKSVNTASCVESISPGGEVEFVKKVIVDPSLVLKTNVRVYSTMLGKKCSMKPLLQYLKENNITNVCTTEFCQGHTMRWGLAWSCDSNIQLAKLMKSPKKHIQPLCIKLESSKHIEKSMGEWQFFIEGMFNDLKVEFFERRTDAFKCEKISWIVTAFENTWSHQRSKRRREMMGVKKIEGEKIEMMSGRERTSEHKMMMMAERRLNQANDDHNDNANDRVKTNRKNVDDGDTDDGDADGEEPTGKKLKLDVNVLSDDTTAAADATTAAAATTNDNVNNNKAVLLDNNSNDNGTSENNINNNNNNNNNNQFIIQFILNLLNDGKHKSIQFEWLAGSCRDLMHQFYQYVVNFISKFN